MYYLLLGKTKTIGTIQYVQRFMQQGNTLCLTSMITIDHYALFIEVCKANITFHFFITQVVNLI